MNYVAALILWFMFAANVLWFMFLLWFTWTTIQRLDELEDEVTELRAEQSRPSGTPADVDDVG